MEWEKPRLFEISLACEIGSYENAELDDSSAPTERGASSAGE
jgi:hypothetical protein